MNVHRVNVGRGIMASHRAETTRRSAADDEMVLAVLDAVERDTHMTQRHMASELGIALGLANAYLKRCIRKGLIKVRQVQARRFAYYLTRRGFAEKSRLTASYLAHSLSFFRRARQQCGELFVLAAKRGQHRIVLIGPGDLAEIASLVAREFPVTVLGTVPADEEPDRLQATTSELGAFDAVILTAMERPLEVFAAATEAFGSDRVHAPRLLRVHPPSLVPGASK
jgi:ribosomal protein S25